MWGLATCHARSNLSFLPPNTTTTPPCCTCWQCGWRRAAVAAAAYALNASLWSPKTAAAAPATAGALRMASSPGEGFAPTSVADRTAGTPTPSRVHQTPWENPQQGSFCGGRLLSRTPLARSLPPQEAALRLTRSAASLSHKRPRDSSFSLSAARAFFRSIADAGTPRPPSSYAAATPPPVAAHPATSLREAAENLAEARPGMQREILCDTQPLEFLPSSPSDYRTAAVETGDTAPVKTQAQSVAAPGTHPRERLLRDACQQQQEEALQQQEEQQEALQQQEEQQEALQQQEEQQEALQQQEEQEEALQQQQEALQQQQQRQQEPVLSSPGGDKGVSLPSCLQTPAFGGFVSEEENASPHRRPPSANLLLLHPTPSSVERLASLTAAAAHREVSPLAPELLVSRDTPEETASSAAHALAAAAEENLLRASPAQEVSRRGFRARAACASDAAAGRSASSFASSSNRQLLGRLPQAAERTARGESAAVRRTPFPMLHSRQNMQKKLQQHQADRAPGGVSQASRSELLPTPTKISTAEVAAAAAAAAARATAYPRLRRSVSTPNLPAAALPQQYAVTETAAGVRRGFARAPWLPLRRRSRSASHLPTLDSAPLSSPTTTAGASLAIAPAASSRGRANLPSARTAAVRSWGAGSGCAALKRLPPCETRQLLSLRRRRLNDSPPRGVQPPRASGAAAADHSLAEAQPQSKAAARAAASEAEAEAATDSSAGAAAASAAAPRETPEEAFPASGVEGLSAAGEQERCEEESAASPTGEPGAGLPPVSAAAGSSPPAQGDRRLQQRPLGGPEAGEKKAQMEARTPECSAAAAASPWGCSEKAPFKAMPCLESEAAAAIAESRPPQPRGSGEPEGALPLPPSKPREFPLETPEGGAVADTSHDLPATSFPESAAQHIPPEKAAGGAVFAPLATKTGGPFETALLRDAGKQILDTPQQENPCTFAAAATAAGGFAAVRKRPCRRFLPAEFDTDA
ncbi:AF4/FMR2 family member 4 [Cyclospora cayetanensis]|uniref:AF4/FMR2 family member 4 n=1 Tax=Cyclospora cayetanensis TaxID=88456 RepID=A0A6P6RW80_9EIME|nr:AF4/FMR2 family member 4 [Cyclospora cayetanensis]